jgi:hypothetical protein
MSDACRLEQRGLYRNAQTVHHLTGTGCRHASRDSTGERLSLLAAAGETLENAPLFRAPGAANTK